MHITDITRTDGCMCAQFSIALGKYMKEEMEKQTVAAQGVVRTGYESASDLRARRCASPTAAYASFPTLWANTLATRGSASGSGFATPTGKNGKPSDVDEAAVKLAAAHLVTPLRVWTSHLKRSMQTAAYIKGVNSEPWKALNEIDAVCNCTRDCRSNRVPTANSHLSERNKIDTSTLVPW